MFPAKIGIWRTFRTFWCNLVADSPSEFLGSQQSQRIFIIYLCEVKNKYVNLRMLKLCFISTLGFSGFWGNTYM